MLSYAHYQKMPKKPRRGKFCAAIGGQKMKRIGTTPVKKAKAKKKSAVTRRRKVAITVAPEAAGEMSTPKPMSPAEVLLTPLKAVAAPPSEASPAAATTDDQPAATHTGELPERIEAPADQTATPEVREPLVHADPEPEVRPPATEAPGPVVDDSKRRAGEMEPFASRHDFATEDPPAAAPAPQGKVTAAKAPATPAPDLGPTLQQVAAAM